jgi:hypothetical protein
MKRFMAFLSEAEEVDVLRNEPVCRINVSPNFENNNRIRCFALKQHGSRKIAQQNAAGNDRENKTSAEQIGRHGDSLVACPASRGTLTRQTALWLRER